MASIIFYGAGRNAHEHFNDWKAQGLIPVCFSDLDISKHHTRFTKLCKTDCPRNGFGEGWNIHFPTH